MLCRKRRGNTAPAEASTGGSALASASESARKRRSRVSGSLSQLILQAFEASNPRKKLSLAALKKLVAEAGFNVSKNNSRLKRELNNLVSGGLLVRLTGSGASGSFKLCGHQTKKKTAGGGKPKKATAAAGSRQPKKARKKQPAVNKPKRLQNRTSAAPGRKRQLNKRPAAKRAY